MARMVSTYQGLYEQLNQINTICQHYQPYVKDFKAEGGMSTLMDRYCDELINMAFLLAISDGTIDYSELQAINKVFKTNYTYEGLEARYGLDVRTPNSFLQKIPYSIKKIAEVESQCYTGLNITLNHTRTMIKAMRDFSVLVFRSKYERTSYEKDVAGEFLGRILNFVVNVEQGNFDFTKEEREKKEAENKVTNSNGKISLGNRNILVNAPKSDDIKVQVPQITAPEVTAPHVEAPRVSAPNVSISYEQPVAPSPVVPSPVMQTPVASTQLQKNEMELAEVNRNIEMLVGLKNAKAEFAKLAEVTAFPSCLNYILVGNRGTGKTTVAATIAKLYKALGIVRSDVFVECDLGNGAEIRSAFDMARGGVIEVSNISSVATNDENERVIFEQIILPNISGAAADVKCIISGTKEEIDRYTSKYPQIAACFGNNIIILKDYMVDDLLKIIKLEARRGGYIIDENNSNAIREKIMQLKMQEMDNFAYAKSVLKYFEGVKSRQVVRAAGIGGFDAKRILEQDL